MKKLLFIKLGGGILTDKSKPYVLNDKFIKILPNLLPKNLLDKYDLILGNGAGSFGHYEAKKADLGDTFQNSNDRVGAAQTHLAAQKLQSIVADKLLAAGWPVFTVSPSDIIDGDKINISTIKHLLDSGLVPLVHGDVIVGRKPSQFCIYSTEKIAGLVLPKLMDKYEEIQVIFLTNVAGVLDNGQVLRQISIKDKFTASTDKNYDVTGGMTEKIRGAAVLAGLGAKVTIASGYEPSVVERILSNEKIGTKIKV